MYSICVQLKNNCTSNSQAIAQSEAKCNFDSYKLQLFFSCMQIHAIVY